MCPGAEPLQRIRELYDAGLFLQAYATAKAVGPLKEWRGPEGRVMAARLAGQIGSPKLAFALFRLAHREHPDHPLALYYHISCVQDRRGPLASLEALRRFGDLPDAPPRVRSDWCCLAAQVHGMLRDFETAEQWLDRAADLDPDRAWMWVERASLLERQDRYPEALEAARRALSFNEHYVPAIRAVAHALQLTERDREALDLLVCAASRSESGALVAQLAILQTELSDHEAALRSWDRVAELSPLADKSFFRWLDAHRSDAEYHCGNFGAAADFAEKCKGTFHELVAKNLRAARGDVKRVQLEVGFVRQHHMTCAPATLSALSRFWSMPADHLSVAETICYDGTPSHSERLWAEQSGYIAREFRADWDSARTLLDRGVPFTFTTVEPASAHLQAVIGYDSRRGTLLVRDPFVRNTGEFLADGTFQRYRSTGPRGMVLVPKDRAHLLEGLTLPEANVYDRLYETQRALLRYDRDAAYAAYQSMCAEYPGHRLTLWAKRALAAYDGNVTDQLAAIDALLAQDPDDANLQLARLSYLRQLGRRDEAIELLGAICSKKGCDPLFWEQRSQELREDARRNAERERLIRKALRYRPTQASTFHALAGVMWSQRRLEEAVSLYRAAACLDDKDERLAQSYFVAARHLKQADRVLIMLRDRFSRFGKRSAAPARALFFALEQLDRQEEAFDALEAALKLRPEDGDLLLFAADRAGQWGRLELARERLEAARAQSTPATWLRTAAELALYAGEATEALRLWRSVLESDPLAVDAHRRVAMLLAQTDSAASAAAHLQDVCRRFPHHYLLQQLRAEWLREEDPAGYAQAIRSLVATHPNDAWARRELATVLLLEDRVEEAVSEVQVALSLEPTSPYSHATHGSVLTRAGKRDEARAALRQAITLSADTGFAIGRLVALGATIDERKDALHFVKSELVRQTIFGDGLLAFREAAQGVLDPDELLTCLKEALAQRPDLWHAWSAATRQLTDMNRVGEAEANARQAVERFPLLPRLWLDLAGVCKLKCERDAELSALVTAQELSPTWGVAARQLADAYDRAAELDKARLVLERAVTRNRGEAANHGMLADVLWRMGYRDAALARIQEAVRVDPAYGWGWDALLRWSTELRRPTLARDLATELTRTRPGDTRSWLALADILGGANDSDDRLAALQKATALDPRSVGAHDRLACALALQGRYDEAIGACHPPSLGEFVPTALRGRAAWIERRRGNNAGAIRQMREVLAADPNYLWGRGEVCDWLRGGTDNAAYLEAAEALVKLVPSDARALSYRGEARLRCGDRAGAKADFLRATSVAPDSVFAAGKSFDLELEDGDLAAARQALEHLRRHAAGGWTELAAVRLAVASRDRTGAVNGFFRVCTDRSHRGAAREPALQVMKEAGFQAEAESMLGEALRRGPTDPRVGELLVHALATTRRWDGPRQWAEFLLGHETGLSGASLYMEIAGRRGEIRRLQKFLRRHQKQLRASDTLWGSAGLALQLARRSDEAVRWMSDWRQRKHCPAWAALPLSEALRSLGRDREAHDVSFAASMAAQYTDAVGGNCLWLAADAALAGDAVSACNLLKRVKMQSQPVAYQFVRSMVDALLLFSAGEPGAFEKARAIIEGAARQHANWRQIPELKRLHRRCLWKLFSGAGGWLPRAWCVRRLMSA